MHLTRPAASGSLFPGLRSLHSSKTTLLPSWDSETVLANISVLGSVFKAL